MLTDEQASSWKKAMNTIQQDKGRKCSPKNKTLAERKQWIQFNNNGNTEMLTDEQASSWMTAMNSIQQNGRKQMLTDERAFSWKKAMNLIQ